MVTGVLDIRCAAARRCATPRYRTGFTLIELIVTVTILAVMVGLGAPSFSNLIATNRAKAAATDVYVALANTRSEAVTRNASVTLSPNAAGWQAGWQILDASSNVLETHGAVLGVTIAGGPTNVVYQSSGRPQGGAASSFLITSTGYSSIQRCVLVASSGRPYLKASAC
jgi:type IV fimbrial biogenesis protein FimT